jgi:hypothetical protein
MDMFIGKDYNYKSNAMNHFYTKYGHPRNWGLVLKYYPNLRLCFAGFGGNNLWKRGIDNDVIDNLKWREKLNEFDWITSIVELTRNPNVYVDISGLNIFDQEVKIGLWRMLDLICECTKCERGRQPGKCARSYKHFKEKLIFGSDWYHVYFTEDFDKDKYSYDEYCSEFRKLFDRVDKDWELPKGEFWERVSLINPWSFYGFSNKNGDKNKIQEMYEALLEIYGTDPFYAHKKRMADNMRTTLIELENYILERIHYTLPAIDAATTFWIEPPCPEKCVREEPMVISKKLYFKTTDNSNDGLPPNHYTAIKTLLNANLSEDILEVTKRDGETIKIENTEDGRNTLFLFNSMDDRGWLRIGRTNYTEYVIDGRNTIRGVNNGGYISENNVAHTHIEACRDGRTESRPYWAPYQLTIHELWHNIDVQARQLVGDKYYCDVGENCPLNRTGTCYQTLLREAYSMDDGEKRDTAITEINAKSPISNKSVFYWYKCNEIGRAIERDVLNGGRNIIRERLIAAGKDNIDVDAYIKKEILKKNVNDIKKELLTYFERAEHRLLAFSLSDSINIIKNDIEKESFVANINRRYKARLKQEVHAHIDTHINNNNEKESLKKEMNRIIDMTIKDDSEEKRMKEDIGIHIDSTIRNSVERERLKEKINAHIDNYIQNNIDKEALKRNINADIDAIRDINGNSLKERINGVIEYPLRRELRIKRDLRNFFYEELVRICTDSDEGFIVKRNKIRNALNNASTDETKYKFESELEKANNQIIAFYWLCNIVSGECTIYGEYIKKLIGNSVATDFQPALFDIDKEFIAHLDTSPDETYWTEARLAMEYFAIIGSLRGVTPETFKEIIGYLPESYKVYNEITKLFVNKIQSEVGTR